MEKINHGFNDTDIVDRIATLLGTASDWDSPADILTDIANLVEMSGRPYPGEHEPDVFAEEFERITGRPVVAIWDAREGGE